MKDPDGEEPMPPEIDRLVQELLGHGVAKETILDNLRNLLEIVHCEIARKHVRADFARSRIRVLTLFASKELKLVSILEINTMAQHMPVPIDINLTMEDLVRMPVIGFCNGKLSGVSRILNAPVRTKDKKVFLVYEEGSHFLFEEISTV